MDYKYQGLANLATASSVVATAVIPRDILPSLDLVTVSTFTFDVSVYFPYA